MLLNELLMNYPDIDILNKRFGAPGRIAFRSGQAGLPIIALVNSVGSCEVSLYGAHVLGYRPMGHAPVLFISKESLFEPGKPIRGGIFPRARLARTRPLFLGFPIGPYCRPVWLCNGTLPKISDQQPFAGHV